MSTKYNFNIVDGIYSLETLEVLRSNYLNPSLSTPGKFKLEKVFKVRTLSGVNDHAPHTKHHKQTTTIVVTH
jgi:hypothetical protein